MSKIPKIAWFHYAGEPMSWMRQRGIETFRDQNPTWDVRVIGTPEDIAARTFVRDLPKKGDWTGWRMLREHGGFVFHSDAVYLRPVPKRWLNYDLVAQVFRDGYTRSTPEMVVGDVHQIPAFGAAPGNPLPAALDDECARASDGDYHNYGVQLLHKIVKGDLLRFGLVCSLAPIRFCPYGWDKEVDQMWTDGGPSKVHTKETIGIHWYAGHPRSIEMEHRASPGGKTWIERVAATGAAP